VDRSAADNFKFNTETEFAPILGLLASNLNAPTDKSQRKSKEPTSSGIQDNHHSALLAVLAEEMNVKPEEIHDFEL
jgi:aspartyl aminopeptidase